MGGKRLEDFQRPGGDAREGIQRAEELQERRRQEIRPARTDLIFCTKKARLTTAPFSRTSAFAHPPGWCMFRCKLMDTHFSLPSDEPMNSGGIVERLERLIAQLQPGDPLRMQLADLRSEMME